MQALPTDHQVRWRIQMLCIVSFKHGNARLCNPRTHGRVIVLVGSLHGVPCVLEEAGEGPHAGSANPDEVYACYFIRCGRSGPIEYAKMCIGEVA